MAQDPDQVLSPPTTLWLLFYSADEEIVRMQTSQPWKQRRHMSPSTELQHNIKSQE